jgi:hypothetical protein
MTKRDLEGDNALLHRENVMLVKALTDLIDGMITCANMGRPPRKDAPCLKRAIEALDVAAPLKGLID